MKNNRSLAFTLAEILLVIGVIGVVASLTIPNLSRDADEQATMARVKKTYADLNTALGRAKAKYGPVSTWGTLYSDNATSSKLVGGRILEFMNVDITCGTGYNTSCFKIPTYIADGSSNSTSLPSDSIYKTLNNTYKAILADGTAVGIDSDYIFIDIDGPKGINRSGIDMFYFFLDRSSLSARVRTSRSNDRDAAILNVCFFGSTPDLGYYEGQVGGCSDWIMKYNNMDYSQLTSAKECPNGSYLSCNPSHSCN